jgi:hypothetical protein
VSVLMRCDYCPPPALLCQCAAWWNHVSQNCAPRCAQQTSTSVGTLEVGEFVTVLETRQLESGQLRARFQYTLQKMRLGRDGGWTSITTTDGERMMGASRTLDCRSWYAAVLTTALLRVLQNAYKTRL